MKVYLANYEYYLRLKHSRVSFHLWLLLLMSCRRLLNVKSPDSFSEPPLSCK
ncbi:hypothetical protein Hanom_Chr05g00462651 [Helianthus anomalus]